MRPKLNAAEDPPVLLEHVINDNIGIHPGTRNSHILLFAGRTASSKICMRLVPSNITALTPMNVHRTNASLFIEESAHERGND